MDDKENKNKNKNKSLFIVLWIAVLVAPLLLNGFISFTDWIQFGIVAYILYKIDMIDDGVSGILFIIFLLWLF